MAREALAVSRAAYRKSLKYRAAIARRFVTPPEPDYTPDELERKHILLYPDPERRAWMRRQMAHWLEPEDASL